MGYLKAAVTFIVVAALIVFIGQNTNVVDVHFLVWKLEMSRAVMLLAVLALGFLLGWVSSSIAGLRVRALKLSSPRPRDSKTHPPGSAPVVAGARWERGAQSM